MCLFQAAGARTALVLLSAVLHVGQGLPVDPPRSLGPDLASSQASKCDALFGGASQATLLMVADPGSFSGLSEAHYFLSQLRDAVVAPPGLTLCQEVVRGVLLGQPVAVVTTGIGQRAAASCSASLIMLCAGRIKEIVLFGTAGCSVQRGGVLNSANCSAANSSPQVTRIGDICISPLALDGTCRMASWQQQCSGSPDVCTMPQQSAGPDAQEILGKCLFSTMPPGSVALTEELLEAAGAARGAYPTRPDSVVRYEANYWAAMAAGTGVAYDVGTPEEQPSILDMSGCAETDSSFYYEGVPFDMQARAGVAALIQQAMGGNVTTRDVVAFSTMEAVGLLHTMDRYLGSEEGRTHPIPYTILRTCSDYTHSPVVQNADGSWAESAKPHCDMAAGYRHAIATGSTAILRLLQQRCLAAGWDSCSLLPAL